MHNSSNMDIDGADNYVCAGCQLAITDNLYLSCSSCQRKYDLLCLNMSKECFQALQECTKDSWTCPECRRLVPKTDYDNSPARALYASHLSDTCDTNVTHRKKPTRPTSLKVVLPTPDVHTMAPSTNAPLNITQQIQEGFKLTMETYVMSALNDFSNKFFIRLDKLTATMESISSRLTSFDERITSLETRFSDNIDTNQNNELVVEVEKLKCQINERDQELLINDLEITGVPESTNENKLHLITLIGQKVGVTVSEHDVMSVTRVGVRRAVPAQKIQSGAISPDKSCSSLREATPHVRGAEGQGAAGASPESDITSSHIMTSRPLVVRFVRRDQRDQLLRAARVRRVIDTTGLGFPGKPSRVYINERLTSTNRQLFYKTRMEARRLQWRNPWTTRGNIFVRRDAEHSAIKIRSEADIGRVFRNE
ncbi:uncharacterized protein LOC134745452 [Cydia strobilella]|uniref:uncharacterized protein LOC134745452 n=1 Tax=Cydia strobilella TaxID=1100964 RepID=UPI003007987A